LITPTKTYYAIVEALKPPGSESNDEALDEEMSPTGSVPYPASSEEAEESPLVSKKDETTQKGGSPKTPESSRPKKKRRRS
jgi:hypothetical protein